MSVLVESTANIAVTVEPAQVHVVTAAAVGSPGPAGPTGVQGPPGTWTKLTQAEYDALPVKDPSILYVIVG